MTEPLLTVPQAAKRLALSKPYIYRLVAERRIPFVRVGKALRFDPEKLNEWVIERSTDKVGR